MLNDLDTGTNQNEIPLPTPEDRLREISRSQPVTLVPIDTSGTPFNRQSEYRSSLRNCSVQYVSEGTLTVRRKQRRRQTVSGIPGHIYDEITNENFKVSSSTTNLNRTRSASRERWHRSRSQTHMDAYIPFSDNLRGRRSRSKEKKRKYDRDGSPISRSCSLRRSFRSLFKDKRSKSTDLWADGRPESPEPNIYDFNTSMRRSRSLPRFLRSAFKGSVGRLTGSRSASTEGRLDSWADEDESLLLSETESNRSARSSSTQDRNTVIRGKPPKPPTRSPARFPSIRKARSYHTGIGVRSTGFDVSEEGASPSHLTPRGRPKSMDILDGPASNGMVPIQRPIPVQTPTTPADVNLEHLTPAQREHQRALLDRMKMNIPPWASPFADDVRFRQQKVMSDDRQSSSGRQI